MDKARELEATLEGQGVKLSKGGDWLVELNEQLVKSNGRETFFAPSPAFKLVVATVGRDATLWQNVYGDRGDPDGPIGALGCDLFTREQTDELRVIVQSLLQLHQQRQAEATVDRGGGKAKMTAAQLEAEAQLEADGEQAARLQAFEEAEQRAAAAKVKEPRWQRIKQGPKARGAGKSPPLADVVAPRGRFDLPAGYEVEAEPEMDCSSPRVEVMAAPTPVSRSASDGKKVEESEEQLFARMFSEAEAARATKRSSIEARLVEEARSADAAMA